MAEVQRKADGLAFWTREAAVLAVSARILSRSWQGRRIGEAALGIGILLALSSLNYAWTQYQSGV